MSSSCTPVAATRMEIMPGGDSAARRPSCSSRKIHCRVGRMIVYGMDTATAVATARLKLSNEIVVITRPLSARQNDLRILASLDENRVIKRMAPKTTAVAIDTEIPNYNS